MLTVQIEAFIATLDSTNSLLAAYANATAYIPDPVYVDNFTSVSACPSNDTSSQVLGKARPSSIYIALGYDFGLFSFAGCRCVTGFDNIYSVDNQGSLIQAYTDFAVA